MAHELGHLVMHVGNPPISSEQAEEEADAFASEFLMPEREIKQQLYNLNESSLCLLKRRWKVSMHALVRRAKDLNTITQQQYRNIQINFSRKGYTKSEPVPLSPEIPFMWDDIINLYKEELGYSNNDLMSMMHINSKDYFAWFVHKPAITLSFRPRL